jgi:spore germination protein GerM
MKLARGHWIAIAAVVILGGAVWAWFAFGPGRSPKLSPERLAPLASELEGIRGVYLYFGKPGSDSLAAEYRDVVVKDRPEDQVRAIYRELVTGPTEPNEALLPEGSELINAYYTPRGTLYLNWNRALVSAFRGGSGRERRLISSIVLTAADNLPGVSQVSLLVEGVPVETIGGHYEVLTPLTVAEWR